MRNEDMPRLPRGTGVRESLLWRLPSLPSEEGEQEQEGEGEAGRETYRDEKGGGLVKKERKHDFCYECGSDLGEIPPPPPRCKRCNRLVKGHEGPCGKNRCKMEIIPPTAMDSFFKQTIQAYGVALDKQMMEDHPGILACLAGLKR